MSKDDGLDRVGDNPTGRPRKSSAGQRRRRIHRLLAGTRRDSEKK